MNNDYASSASLRTLANSFDAGVLLLTASWLGLFTALGQHISFVDPDHVTPEVFNTLPACSSS